LKKLEEISNEYDCLMDHVNLYHRYYINKLMKQFNNSQY